MEPMRLDKEAVVALGSKGVELGRRDLRFQNLFRPGRTQLETHQPAKGIAGFDLNRHMGDGGCGRTQAELMGTQIKRHLISPRLIQTWQLAVRLTVAPVTILDPAGKPIHVAKKVV